MLQLADRLGFNLPHAFARDLKDAAYLFQRVGVAVAQAVAELDDLTLAIGERLEDLLDFVLEHFLRGGAHRRFGAVVFNKVAEVTVFAFAYRPIEADGMPANLEHPARLFDGDARGPGRFFNGRLAPHFL